MLRSYIKITLCFRPPHSAHCASVYIFTKQNKSSVL